MKDDIRERIVKEGELYKVLNTDLSFDNESITQEINQYPERFSPNVVMRPLYQETILPNLAYLGGPAEVAYWMQLKPVFDHYTTLFPMLLPRNFALIMNKTNGKKFSKTGIDLMEIFLPLQELIKGYIEKHGSEHIQMNEDKKALSAVFKELINKAKQIDGSLEGFIGAEENKALKSLDNIEKRLTKAEEKKHEDGIKQIEALSEKLFPSGKPQERIDNFLTFYINNPDFIQNLIDGFDPLDFSMYVFFES